MNRFDDAKAWYLLPFAAFLLFTAGAAWIAAGAHHAGWFSDSVEYLTLADFFRHAFGFGDVSKDALPLFRGTRLPPLFPLSLALGGGGTLHQHAAFVVTCVTAVFAAMAAWWWIAAAIGHRAIASCLAFAAIFVVGAFLLLTNVVSEPLYALLMFAAFALAERNLDRRIFVLALLVGVLPLARSIGLTVVAGFCAWLVFQPGLPSRRRVVAAAISFAPLVGWSAFRAVTGAHSYTHIMTKEFFISAFGSWSGFFVTQPVRMINALVDGIDPDNGVIAVGIILVLLVPALVGGVRRLIQRRLDAFCIPMYLGLVWIWPYPAEIERFMLPLWPVFVAWAFTGLAWLSQRFGRSDRDPALALAIGIAGAIAVAGAMPVTKVIRAALRDQPAELQSHMRRAYYLLEADPVEAQLILETDANIVATLQRIPDVIPQGQCLYAEIPGLVRLYTGYDVALIPPALDLAAPLAPQLPGCEWFFVSALATAQHDVSGGRLIEALAPLTEPVVATFVGPNLDDETSPRQVAAAVLRRRTADE